MIHINLRLATLDGQPVRDLRWPVRQPVSVGFLTPETLAAMNDPAPYAQHLNDQRCLFGTYEVTPDLKGGEIQQDTKVPWEPVLPLAHEPFWRELFALDRHLLPPEPHLLSRHDDQS